MSCGTPLLKCGLHGEKGIAYTARKVWLMRGAGKTPEIEGGWEAETNQRDESKAASATARAYAGKPAGAVG